MAPVDPGASSIAVAVRVRPFTIREAAQLQRTDDGTVFLGDGSLAAAPTPKLNQRGLRSVIKVVDDKCLVFDPPEDNPVQKFSRSVIPTTGKRVKDQVFAFDRIFDDNATQMDVYEGTTKGLLDSVLDGYNATVFAYGATGCGKTHTITGSAQQPGIIFLTMQELFEKIGERKDDKVTELSLSYLEIYNETIRDLLVPGGNAGNSKQGLMLREDTNHAVTVAGLSSHHPKDVQEVMDMIVQGNECRTVSPTEANAVSSRSHAVLQINVAQRDRNANVNEPHTMATLSIIDLAGSERASATKNRGERLLEGANINKSLLALGGCINALCDVRRRNHVPYRNSKLTRLLKFSLGGNCKTVMIVCVSPSSAHFDETQNTLRYANRAKNIQTKVTRNVFNVNRHVKDFLVKIDEQMVLINELKAQQRDSEKTFGLKVRKQLDKLDAVTREGIQRLRVAYDNAAPDRQQKVADMKKLRCIERRIGLLSAWTSAFDGTCTAHGNDCSDDGDEVMPLGLAPLRKTVRGILAELENSRHHLHHKIQRCNWERPLDSALQHSITQITSAVADSVVADADGAIASLTRETELLKANFAREACQEVMEQDKASMTNDDMTKTLLAAQFEMLASLSAALAMGREEAVAHCQNLVNRLLESGTSAVTQVVKPDTSASISSSVSSAHSGNNYVFPPSMRGTPKKKKTATSGSVPPMRASRPSVDNSAAGHLVGSPSRPSPRRRKIGSTTRKGVSFTPVKKKSTPLAASKRSVRWRDDESEEGTLADFAQTPRKSDGLPAKRAAVAEPIPEVTVAEEPEEESVPAVGEAPLVSHTLHTMDTVPEEDASPASSQSPELPRPVFPAYLNRADLDDEDDSNTSSTSPFLAALSPSTLPGGPILTASTIKPSRFQAGFLSKPRMSIQNHKRDDSPRGPLPPTLSMTLNSSSDSETPEKIKPRITSPLQSISQASSQRKSSLSPGSRIPSYSGSPKLAAALSSMTLDENTPPAQSAPGDKGRSPRTSSASDVSSSGGHSETDETLDLTSAFDLSASTLDAKKLRSAIHSAKKAHHRPSMSASVGAAGRQSSSGNINTRRFSVGGVAHHHRVSAGGLASSTNGISRQRRRSTERHSPPIACSPPSDSVGGSGSGNVNGSSSGAGRSRDGAASRGMTLTPGQLRRVNLGGSLRLDSTSGSPRERVGARDGRPLTADASKARRITIGSAAIGHAMSGVNGSAKKEAPQRQSVVWR